MSKITRWRRGLWAAGQWWSNAWPWMMSSGSRGARNLQFQTTQFILLIFLLLLALTSAVIRPPYDYPTKLSSTFQPNKHLYLSPCPSFVLARLENLISASGLLLLVQSKGWTFPTASSTNTNIGLLINMPTAINLSSSRHLS